jgi:integrase/recombinase XerD
MSNAVTKPLRLREAGAHSSTKKDTTKYDLVESFLLDLKLRGMSKHTLIKYSSSMRIFERWLQDDLSAAGRDALREYVGVMRQEGLSHKTMCCRLTAMSSFYGFLEDEGLIDHNIIPYVIKKYLRSYKSITTGETRQLISVQQASSLVNGILSTRDRALLILLLKTGMRVGEMASLELSDIDIDDLTLTLKPTPKRSNLTLFFDYETAGCLEDYLRIRGDSPGPLFLSRTYSRLNVSGIEDMVKRHAQVAGLHNPASRRLRDRFTPHCCRHWFTTHLDRAGMKREYIQELRGDVHKEAIDIYIHIDPEKLKESYLAHIPQLGV